MQNNTVQCEVSENALRITILGEIDHHSAKSIREEIDRSLFYHRPKKLILVLSEVGFMDSSGLGLILGRLTRMQELGGSLILAEPTPQIVKILHLAGLEKQIAIEGKTEKKKNAPAPKP